MLVSAVHVSVCLKVWVWECVGAHVLVCVCVRRCKRGGLCWGCARVPILCVWTSESAHMRTACAGPREGERVCARTAGSVS